MLRFKSTRFVVWVVVSLFIGVTSFMTPEVYSSWWWFLFWAIIGVGLCISIIKGRLWRKPTVFIIHFSFILMLVGGAVTALFGKKGSVHLLPGQPENVYVATTGEIKKLPFSLTLKEFRPEYYPGMTFPRDFRSTVAIDDGRTLEISMNNIGREQGWRMYQTSYDAKGGTVLSLSHDPVGIGLTYAGYALFALGGFIHCLMAFFKKQRKSSLIVAAIVLSSLVPVNLSAMPSVPETLADSLESCQVIFNGRVMPFATMASELTYKITGKGSVASMSPTRFIASIIVFPDEWRTVPFIKVKDKKLQKSLGSVGAYASMASLYDKDGIYIPEKIYEGGDGKLDTEILKLDEKVALIASLWNGTLFIPIGAGHSEAKNDEAIRSELIYVKAQPVKIFFMIALTFAFIGITVFGLSIMKNCLWAFAISFVLFIIGVLIFLWQWTIVGHIPLTSSGGIMFFASVVLCGVSALVARHSPFAAMLGLMTAGFASILAWLSVKDPLLTPLMPVLASPWLAIHVSLVMIAYAILGFTFPLAVASLLCPSLSKPFAALSLKLLWPGIYVLGLGIITGAMWANVSWGRYWGWDAKETWALVTMLLYSVPLHFRLKAFHLYMILAFLSIIMTYAGVNYLPSLHAYN